MTEFGPLTVRCPTCRAKPGEPCVTLGNRQPMTMTHRYRQPYQGKPKGSHLAGQYRQQQRRRKT